MRRRSFPARSVYAVVLLAAAIAVADDEPRALVRARLDPPGPVATGQSVRLVVEVLVTTWLTGQPELPPLDLPGAIVAPSGEQASNLTQSIDGTTYFGVALSYLVTPTGDGDVAIPPITLTVSPGQASAPIQVTTAPLTLAVKAVPRPPGAEHAVGTTRFTLSQQLDRSLDGIRTGDAVKRTIEASAAGARAMFLPPVEFPPISGLAVYPDAPRVEDVTKDRVGFVGGRRIDAATYVVQQPGTYELPALTVQWWDTAAGTLRTASLPALRFRAVGRPASDSEQALPSGELARMRREERLVRIGVWAGALLAAALLAWLSAPYVRRAAHAVVSRRRERRRRREASEPWAFRRFGEAARHGDAATIYASLLRWLERAGPDASPMTIAALRASAADPRLDRSVEALEARLYGTDAAKRAWSASDLATAVTRARWRLQAREHEAAHADVPPLNPA